MTASPPQGRDVAPGRLEGAPGNRGAFLLVRPAGRTCFEVKVLYSPGKGKS